jgi:hypothetical protein
VVGRERHRDLIFLPDFTRNGDIDASVAVFEFPNEPYAILIVEPRIIRSAEVLTFPRCFCSSQCLE